jgi:hypothetical protein
VLLDVYPDARIAVTHRDPLTVLASVSSLVATLRYAHSDRVDMTEIGRYHADLYHADLDRLAVDDAAGALPADRIHHSRYADFITDGVAVVRSVYSAAGRELDPETARRMAAHLSDRPKDHLGTHEYHFADLGLDLATETARFDRYRTHFGIPVEPPA